jgi:hypothetical protein
MCPEKKRRKNREEGLEKKKQENKGMSKRTAKCRLCGKITEFYYVFEEGERC